MMNISHSHIYLYTNIPILFDKIISVQIYILNIFKKKYDGFQKFFLICTNSHYSKYNFFQQIVHQRFNTRNIHFMMAFSFVNAYLYIYLYKKHHQKCDQPLVIAYYLTFISFI